MKKRKISTRILVTKVGCIQDKQHRLTEIFPFDSLFGIHSPLKKQQKQKHCPVKERFFRDSHRNIACVHPYGRANAFRPSRSIPGESTFLLLLPQIAFLLRKPHKKHPTKASFHDATLGRVFPTLRGGGERRKRRRRRRHNRLSPTQKRKEEL